MKSLPIIESASTALPFIPRDGTIEEQLKAIAGVVHPGTPKTQVNMLLEHAACYGCGEPLCQYICPLGNPMNRAHKMTVEGFSQQAAALWRVTNPVADWMKSCNHCVRGCIAGHNGSAIIIGDSEAALARTAIENGWWKPVRPAVERKEHVILVGSGPAAVAQLDLLRSAGIQVSVVEANDVLFGYVARAIHQHHVDKDLFPWREQHHRDSGVNFYTNVAVGSEAHPIELFDDRVEIVLDKASNKRLVGDRLCLALGAHVARDYPTTLPGNELRGVHQAMEVIEDYQRMVNGWARPNPILQVDVKYRLSVAGAGLTSYDGRTMNDEIGDSRGDQLVRKPKLAPHEMRPHWSSARDSREAVMLYEGGGTSMWQTEVLEFLSMAPARPGHLSHILVHDKSGDRPVRRLRECNLFLKALGFMGPAAKAESLPEQLGLSCNRGGFIEVDENYNTSHPLVKAVGDCCEGSHTAKHEKMVVYAIHHGLEAAKDYLRVWGLNEHLPSSEA
jgi:glutamate synthase (NADPH/NADH) small chain